MDDIVSNLNKSLPPLTSLRLLPNHFRMDFLSEEDQQPSTQADQSIASIAKMERELWKGDARCSFRRSTVPRSKIQGNNQPHGNHWVGLVGGSKAHCNKPGRNGGPLQPESEKSAAVSYGVICVRVLLSRN